MAGIAKLQEYARSLSTMKRGVSGIAELVSASLAGNWATEQQAEKAVLDAARGQDEPFDPLLSAYVQKAEAYLAGFGFTRNMTEQRQTRLEVLQWGGTCTCTLTCNGSIRTIDFSRMRTWATAKTRQALVEAIEAVNKASWTCSFADNLFLDSLHYSEPASLVWRAFQRNPARLDMDALWDDALTYLEHEEYDHDGEREIHLMGIGNREDFEFWAKNLFIVHQDHAAFLTAPPKGKVDPVRSRLVLDWAKRAHHFATQFRKDFGEELDRIEPGDHRNWAEQLVILTGRIQGAQVDRFFSMTDDGSGEVPGRDLEIGHDGRGLLLAVILGLISQTVLGYFKGGV